MIDICVKNEIDKIETVLLGIGDDFGDIPNLNSCYDPKSKEHVIAGTFPKQEDINVEINNLLEVFNKYNINVIRPKNLKGLNQIFVRDICFVIDNKLIIPNIIDNRKNEQLALNDLKNNIGIENIIYMPEETYIEGGDIILHNEYIFIGYSKKTDFNKFLVARTNLEAVKFIEKTFPNKKIFAFELHKSDEKAQDNILHLDCCFQPIGNNKAIIFKDGFKNLDDFNFLKNIFRKKNIIEINRSEMYNMNANIFSISDDIIISDKSFVRLNKELVKNGFKVEEIDFREVAKMEGLLRCSTMPLKRRSCHK